MKRECTSQLTFRNPRVSIGFALYAAGLVLAMAFIGSVVAGDSNIAGLSQRVELYEPGTWVSTATGSTTIWRDAETATLQPHVLVPVGSGFDGLTNVVSAELYDPATGVWTVTGSLTTG